MNSPFTHWVKHPLPPVLAHRALDAKITISTCELLAASSNVRRHVKDIVTTKKVAANLLEADESDVYSYGVSEPDPELSSIFFNLVKYNPSSSAAASLPLRVIFPTFAPGVEPECILDGGAQIVVMRRDIWEKLQTPITVNKAMSMESANATTTMTLGVLENHPVQLGPITVYLQIQVVNEAPCEFLLGRPFFDITSCAEVSRSGGNHEIHVKDPSTGIPYVFATQPRLRKTSRDHPENSKGHFSGNFLSVDDSAIAQRPSSSRSKLASHFAESSPAHSQNQSLGRPVLSFLGSTNQLPHVSPPSSQCFISSIVSSPLASHSPQDPSPQENLLDSFISLFSASSTGRNLASAFATYQDILPSISFPDLLTPLSACPQWFSNRYAKILSPDVSPASVFANTEVADTIRPVATTLPEDFRVICPEDPDLLSHLPHILT